jgi:hypothetical protein
MVTLTPRKPFALTKPVQLVVYGAPPSGLQDSLGRFIDGKHDGQPGSNAVAVLSRGGATISATTDASGDLRSVARRGQETRAEQAVVYHPTGARLPLRKPDVVDALLERDVAIATKHTTRGERAVRDDLANTQRTAVNPILGRG